jgi:hypothetical protein
MRQIAPGFNHETQGSVLFNLESKPILIWLPPQ